MKKKKNKPMGRPSIKFEEAINKRYFIREHKNGHGDSQGCVYFPKCLVGKTIKIGLIKIKEIKDNERT